MSYIGNQSQTAYSALVKQDITGNGGTSYTLSHPVSNENDILLYINNVKQEGGSGKAFTASGTTLTLSEAIANTDSCYVQYIGLAIQTIVPPDGSVSTAKIADSAITSSKLASGVIIPTAEVLLIGGGGGGGGGLTSAGVGNGGGGGAGGVVFGTVPLVSGSGFNATVGLGGAGATVGSTTRTDGNPSYFAQFKADGGGQGGSYYGGTTMNGNTGGSAGGAGYGSNAGTASTTHGFYQLGNNGGAYTNSGDYPSGGGGGAGSVGGDSTANTGGAGGTGTNAFSTWATATSTGDSGFYASGGGGGSDGGTAGVSPSGGGADGTNSGSTPTAATANTGGGGGGGGNPEGSAGTSAGGAGGSGLVIVRYLSSTNLATGGTITSSGGYKYHTFLSDSTFIVS